MAQRNAQRQLQQTVTALESKHGPGILRSAHDLARRLPAHLSTSFPQLDALTGCGGIPLDSMTILSGRATAGKLTLAYKAPTRIIWLAPAMLSPHE
jgi:hypothetical protein